MELFNFVCNLLGLEPHYALFVLYMFGLFPVVYVCFLLMYPGRHSSVEDHPFWFPFQGFWEQVKWNLLPGAKKLRIAYMKKMITSADDETIFYTGVTFGDIKKGYRYLEMSYKLSSRTQFAFEIILILGILTLVSPFVLPAVIVGVVLSIPSMIRNFPKLWVRSFTYYP